MMSNYLFFYLIASIQLVHAMKAPFEVGGGRCLVDVFEVGQGNCTLIACDGCCPILVDCGSSSSEYTGEKPPVFKRKKLAEIVKRIRDHAAQVKIPELIVIVSHPDDDHYNMLNDLLNNFLIDPLRVKQVLLGCDESLYLQPFKDVLAALTKTGCFVRYLTGVGNTTKVETIISQNGALCQILPALACKNKEDKNMGSLVVKFSYGNSACLIMGDGDGATTDHILRCDEFRPMVDRPDYFSDIKLFIASHHGSDKERCNNIGWMNRVAPACVVLSSGIRGDFHHPHARLVSRMRSFLQTQLAARKGAVSQHFHPLYTETAAEMRASFVNGYGLMAISEPVYGTLSQGTMQFSWGFADTQLMAPTISWIKDTNKRLDWATEKDCLFASLLKAPYTCVSFSALTKVDLARLALDDTNAEDSRNIGLLLEKLTSLAEGLKSLLLCENNLQAKQTLLLLNDLFMKRGNQLHALYARNNRFMLQDIASVFQNGASSQHPVLITMRTDIPGIKAQVKLVPAPMPFAHAAAPVKAVPSAASIVGSWQAPPAAVQKAGSAAVSVVPGFGSPAKPSGLSNHVVLPGTTTRPAASAVSVLAAAPPIIFYEEDSLHKAVDEGNTDLVAKILAYKKAGGRLASLDARGMSPLQLAVWKNRSGMMRLLIQQGEDAGIVNQSKSTLSHIAALCGNREALETLKECAALSQQKNIFGETPYDIAIEHRNYEIAQILKV